MKTDGQSDAVKKVIRDFVDAKVFVVDAQLAEEVARWFASAAAATAAAAAVARIARPHPSHLLHSGTLTKADKRLLKRLRISAW